MADRILSLDREELTLIKFALSREGWAESLLFKKITRELEYAS